jgi:hypothetical protein
MTSQSAIFVTDNLKLAAALTAAGFQILHGEQVSKDGRFIIMCEMELAHNGVKALDLKAGFENKSDLPAQVGEIIALRGITQEEYVILAFDAARAGLHNRSTIMWAIGNNQPLVHKDIGNGRSLIYRQGTPRETLKSLIENA